MHSLLKTISYTAGWNAQTKKAKNHVKLVRRNARPSKESRVYGFLDPEKVIKRPNLQLKQA